MQLVQSVFKQQLWTISDFSSKYIINEEYLNNLFFWKGGACILLVDLISASNKIATSCVTALSPRQSLYSRFLFAVNIWVTTIPS